MGGNSASLALGAFSSLVSTVGASSAGWSVLSGDSSAASPVGSPACPVGSLGASAACLMAAAAASVFPEASAGAPSAGGGMATPPSSASLLPPSSSTGASVAVGPTFLALSRHDGSCSDATHLRLHP